jgi:hypothetical protein
MFRGATEMPLARNGQENPQLPEIDIHAHGVSIDTIKLFDLSMAGQ